MRAIFGWSSLFLVATLFTFSEGYNGCPDVDPIDHTVHLPHPTDCNLFYRCDHGYPKLDQCPATLHFNPTHQVCDWPDHAGCTAEQVTEQPDTTTLPSADKCTTLPVKEGGVWGPEYCTQSPFKLADVCRLTCSVGFKIVGGNDIFCSEYGWIGKKGLNQMPECKAIADLGGEFIDRISRTLEGRNASMIFLLDESYSLNTGEFGLQVQFMKALVAAFPLGANRSAGAVTFSTNSTVGISASTDDTCSFLDQADHIVYGGGGTNILGDLWTAIKEVGDSGRHDFKLIFLITDGESYSDSNPAADFIKSNNAALFTVGIGNFNTDQLRALSSVDENGEPIFFSIDNFEVFQKVAEYLETAYVTSDPQCNSSTPSSPPIPSK